MRRSDSGTVGADAFDNVLVAKVEVCRFEGRTVAKGGRGAVWQVGGFVRGDGAIREGRGVSADAGEGGGNGSF